MGKEVAWQVDLAVKPGQLEAFRALTGEMVEFTRREPGVLSYQRFISEDGNTVHVYERYADSTSGLLHLQDFGARFSKRFLLLVERRRFTVYGEPSPELRKVLDGLGAVYFAPFGDFEYWA